MNLAAFSSPVFVKRGAYLVQEIVYLAGAIEFLEEWPEDRRNLIHETALRACTQAYDGLKPLGVARDAFVDFAKRAGILEDPEAVMPRIAASGQREGAGIGSFAGLISFGFGGGSVRFWDCLCCPRTSPSSRSNHFREGRNA